MIPAASAVTERPAATDVTPPPAEQSRRGAILAVDDDDDILAVVRVYLDSLGYDVHTTNDAERALQLVPAHQFDLVLCDVGMPKQNGLDLCQALRDSGYRGRIVLMTGWDTQRVNVDSRVKTADSVLKKPFLGSELIELIDTMLAPA